MTTITHASRCAVLQVVFHLDPPRLVNLGKSALQAPPASCSCARRRRPLPLTLQLPRQQSATRFGAPVGHVDLQSYRHSWVDGPGTTCTVQASTRFIFEGSGTHTTELQEICRRRARTRPMLSTLCCLRCMFGLGPAGTWADPHPGSSALLQQGSRGCGEPRPGHPYRSSPR